MSGNTYRAVSEYGKAVYGGDAFDGEFSAVEERDHVSAGHLEIVPRAYRVLSNNYEAGKQGDVVELALVVEHEASLIQGGHLERVDKPETNSKRKG